MLGSVRYTPLHDLNFLMQIDDRPYADRLQSFFLRAFATARSCNNRLGTPRILISENFKSEAPHLAIDLINDSFNNYNMVDSEKLRHSGHSFGDPAKIMSCQISVIAFRDISEGRLHDLAFYQYLDSESIIICIQYGTSGNFFTSPEAETISNYFRSQSDAPSAKFLRAHKQLII